MKRRSLGHMEFIFWLSCTIGIAVLVFATSYLIKINWSGDMWPRIISAIGVGVLTLLVTVLATLKDTQEETKFGTSVIFNETIRKPAILRPEPEQALALPFRRQSSLFSIAAEVTETPQTADETFVYLGELVQYKLLSDLKDIQRQGTAIGAVMGSATVYVRPAPVAVKLPDQVELPIAEVLGYDSNRFFKTQSAAFSWEHMGLLRVPSGATVELQNKTQPSKHIIRIEKAGFFSLEININAVGGGSPGSLPGGMNITEGQANQLTTYVFDVSTTARFEKMTAGNWRMEYYKRWVAWLVTELAERNRDL